MGDPRVTHSFPCWLPIVSNLCFHMFSTAKTVHEGVAEVPLTLHVQDPWQIWQPPCARASVASFEWLACVLRRPVNIHMKWVTHLAQHKYVCSSIESKTSCKRMECLLCLLASWFDMPLYGLQSMWLVVNVCWSVVKLSWCFVLIESKQIMNLMFYLSGSASLSFSFLLLFSLVVFYLFF